MARTTAFTGGTLSSRAGMPRACGDPGGQPMIEDLGSSNGTFVNDRRIDGPTALEPGDTIKLGGTTA